jgi:hypothetical protein
VLRAAATPARVVQITAFALGLAATVVWVTVGPGYFWPMWVWLTVAIVLSLQLGIGWAWAQAPGRQRQLALHGTVSAIIVALDVAIWALSGGGLFWPAFPLVALGGAFAVHAALRPQREQDLAVRVEQLTRTRRGALDVQGAELRRIERDCTTGRRRGSSRSASSSGAPRNASRASPRRPNWSGAPARRRAPR